MTIIDNSSTNAPCKHKTNAQFYFASSATMLAIITLSFTWWGAPWQVFIFCLGLTALLFIVATLAPYLRPLPQRVFVSIFFASTLTCVLYKLLLITWVIQLSWFDRLLGLVYIAVDVYLLLILYYMLIDGVHALFLGPDGQHIAPLQNHEDVPLVTVHVPIRNEPIEIVEPVMEALAALDYPAYDVIILDNNTTDENIWRPTEARAQELGLSFYHFERLDGFKAGALNMALSLTPTHSELIAIVDGDYIVAPDFLNATVAAFDDPKVAFVQTAQSSSNASANPITRQFDVLFKFFYDITMIARAERNSIIFGGTMGLIRKSVLEEVGGWAEWCITEDAELSLQFLARGYKGIYTNRVLGQGLVPDNFIDTRQQWYRWVFGGVQYTLRHLKILLLSIGSNLTFRQRLDYFMGGMLLSMSTAGMVLMTLIYTLSIAFVAAIVRNGLFTPEVLDAYSQVLRVTVTYHSFLLMPTIFLGFIVHLQTRQRVTLTIAGLLSSLSMLVIMARASINALLLRVEPYRKTPKGASAYGWPAYFVDVIVELGLLCLVIAATAFAWGPASEYGYGPLLLVLGSWQIFIYANALVKVAQSEPG